MPPSLITDQAGPYLKQPVTVEIQIPWLGYIRFISLGSRYGRMFSLILDKLDLHPEGVLGVKYCHSHIA